VVSLLCVAERADAASRRWKPAVLVVPPDVNPSSPSSIGLLPRAASGPLWRAALMPR
jgi:hypothetical protein